MESLLSYSRVSTYSSCGMKYKLRYKDALPAEPQGALLGGAAIHQAIESYEKAAENLSAPWGADNLPTLVALFVEIFDASLAEAGEAPRWGGRKSKEYPAGEDAGWWRATAPAMLGNYLAVRAEDAAAGSVLHSVEAHVLGELGGTEAQGYIDAIVITGDGEAVIRDYKTSSRYSGDGLQLAAYATLLAKTAGITAVTGEYIFLRTARPESRRQRVNLEALVPVAEQAFADAEQGIGLGYFPMKVSDFCVSCDVRKHCIYGRTKEGQS